MDRIYSNTNCIVHTVFPVSEDKSTEVHFKGSSRFFRRCSIILYIDLYYFHDQRMQKSIVSLEGFTGDQIAS